MKIRNMKNRRVLVTALARRNGFLLVLVMATGLLVAGLGMVAISKTRQAISTVGTSNNQQESMFLAQAALQLGLDKVNDSPQWRTEYFNNTEYPIGGMSLGNGTITWKLVDADGDLADDPNDLATLHGIARVGDTERVLTLILQPDETDFTLRERLWWGERDGHDKAEFEKPVGMFVTPDLPAEAEHYRVTEVSFRMHRHDGDSGILNCRVYEAGGSGSPNESLLLTEASIDISTLPTSDSWVTIPVPETEPIFTATSICVVFEPESGSAHVDFERYQTSENSYEHQLSGSVKGSKYQWSQNSEIYYRYSVKGSWAGGTAVEVDSKSFDTTTSSAGCTFCR